MTDHDWAVRLAGVSKRFGTVRAVDGVDLAIGKTQSRNRIEAVQAARAQGWL